VCKGFECVIVFAVDEVVLLVTVKFWKNDVDEYITYKNIVKVNSSEQHNCISKHRQCCPLFSLDYFLVGHAAPIFCNCIM